MDMEYAIQDKRKCSVDMGHVFLWEKNMCCVDIPYVDMEYMDMEDVFLCENNIWIVMEDASLWKNICSMYTGDV